MLVGSCSLSMETLSSSEMIQVGRSIRCMPSAARFPHCHCAALMRSGYEYDPFNIRPRFKDDGISD